MYVSDYLFAAIAVDPTTADLNVEAILHNETKNQVRAVSSSPRRWCCRR